MTVPGGGNPPSAGAGTTDPAATPPPSAGTQNTDSGGTAAGAGGTAEPTIPKSRLDEETRKRREAEQRAANLEAAEAERARQTADAEEQRAKEQGKFQELAEKHATKLKELEPQVQSLTTERDQLLGLVKQQQQTALEALPEALRKLAPPDTDIVGRQTFLANAQEAAQLLTTQQPGSGGQPAPRGAPPSPKPATSDPVTAGNGTQPASSGLPVYRPSL